jgi:hypothetical protein
MGNQNGKQLRSLCFSWGHIQLRESTEWGNKLNYVFDIMSGAGFDPHLYGCSCLQDYLAKLENIEVYATVIDTHLICGFLQCSLHIYSLNSLKNNQDGTQLIEPTKIYEELFDNFFNLWYEPEHYIPIISIPTATNDSTSLLSSLSDDEEIMDELTVTPTVEDESMVSAENPTLLWCENCQRDAIEGVMIKPRLGVGLSFRKKSMPYETKEAFKYDALI